MVKSMRTINSIVSCALSCVAGLGFATAVMAYDSPNADNTAQNENALKRGVPTAEKQGNRKSDVKALARIRRRIVRENGLSMNAKNAKILFKQGAVTLTGPVDSDAERAHVESVVKSTGGVTSVDNQLTVAPKH